MDTELELAEQEATERGSAASKYLMTNTLRQKRMLKDEAMNRKNESDQIILVSLNHQMAPPPLNMVLFFGF